MLGNGNGTLAPIDPTTTTHIHICSPPKQNSDRGLEREGEGEGEGEGGRERG